jgi:hypothetical protein
MALAAEPARHRMPGAGAAERAAGWPVGAACAASAGAATPSGARCRDAAASPQRRRRWPAPPAASGWRCCSSTPSTAASTARTPGPRRRCCRPLAMRCTPSPRPAATTVAAAPTWGRAWSIRRAPRRPNWLIDALLPFAQAGIAIVGLEPSCLLTLRDEALALGLGERAVTVSKQALLFEEFIAREAGPKRPCCRPSARRHRHTTSPVSGICTCSRPRERPRGPGRPASASITALTTAGVAPMVPSSPTPLAPSGLFRQGMRGVERGLEVAEAVGVRQRVVHEAGRQQLAGFGS